ncbi:MAG: hypothetical protein EOP93_14460 [Lysobacteraceae bacterium]|nr:MAG: hypothetical protein EOP93_14460 [Xanthomonadaceae bacterium]
MQVSKIAAVLAFATLSAGAMADTITAEGFVHSAPVYASATSNVSRAAVQAEAAQAVRADIADTIASEGLRSDTQVAVGQRSRDAVRAEAVQANHNAYAASAQVNEGLV